MRGQGVAEAGSDGSWPGLVGPGSGGLPPEAITIWAMAAAPISANRMMITMSVGRRTARG